MAEITVLNEHFSIPNVLHFSEGPSNLAIAEITNTHASATLLLQGAQLLSWTPDGHRPVIWLSENAAFEPAKSPRGGIPICWPWFGPHPEHTEYPAHGIARTAPWEITHTEELANGGTKLSLMLIQSEITENYWPHPCELHMNIEIGRELKIELISRNTGNSDMRITEALHTYFAISDINKVAIQGLEDQQYIDKVDNGEQKVQEGIITLSNETDRVYINTDSTCQINDAGLNRRIIISKSGSQSTVVWNPWETKAKAMKDMGPGSFQGMLCVETANALENQIVLEAGKEHRMSVDYRVDTFL